MLMKAEREQSFAEVGQGLIITELPRIESIVKDIHSDSIAVWLLAINFGSIIILIT